MKELRTQAQITCREIREKMSLSAAILSRSVKYGKALRHFSFHNPGHPIAEHLRVNF